jgi:hypothetical protein
MASNRGQHDPARHLKGPLRGDRAADIACVALTPGILDVPADRLQLNCQDLDVCIGR